MGQREHRVKFAFQGGVEVECGFRHFGLLQRLCLDLAQKPIFLRLVLVDLSLAKLGVGLSDCTFAPFSFLAKLGKHRLLHFLYFSAPNLLERLKLEHAGLFSGPGRFLKFLLHIVLFGVLSDEPLLFEGFLLLPRHGHKHFVNLFFVETVEHARIRQGLQVFLVLGR